MPDQQGPRCVRLSLLCGNISIIGGGGGGGGVKTRGACGTADITPTLRQQHLTDLITCRQPLHFSPLSREHLWALGSIVRYFSGSCEDIALALVGTPCLSVGGPPLRLVGGEDRS